MKTSNKIKEMPENIAYALSPLYRLEALTGFAGYGLIIHGAVKGNTNEVVAGLIASMASGFYGAYKDGAFSKKIGVDITDRL